MTMENTFCNWAVCYDIDGSNYDDHQTKTVIGNFQIPPRR